MHRAISLALLTAGLLLLALGLNAAQSLDSELSELVTGTPSDKAVWMLVCGVLAAVVGAIGLLDLKK